MLQARRDLQASSDVFWERKAGRRGRLGETPGRPLVSGRGRQKRKLALSFPHPHRQGCRGR